MTDIVYRLRLVDPNQVLLMEPPYDTRYAHAGLICHEAAAEIEQLREALTLIADQSYDAWTNGAEAQRIAESALKRKGGEP